MDGAKLDAGAGAGVRATRNPVRLAREVTVQLKGTALSDLCEQLRRDTSIHLVAGNSVAQLTGW